MPAPKSAPASEASSGLLSKADGPAFEILNEDGGSDILIACDHASQRIPAKLGTLGLSERELDSHIAWDIGARAVSEMVAQRIEATLVMQRFSRLVIDCNRATDAADSITPKGEWGAVPGNEHVSEEDAAARRAEIFEPYHEALRTIIDARLKARRPTLLVAIHSFTPTLRGEDRPWQIGVMFGSDTRMSDALVNQLRGDKRLLLGVNEPYALDGAIDFTLPRHGEDRGIPHVGIEIRQDQIADEAGQKTWAGRLSSLLKNVAVAVAKGR